MGHNNAALLAKGPAATSAFTRPKSPPSEGHLLAMAIVEVAADHATFVKHLVFRNDNETATHDEPRQLKSVANSIM